MQNLRPILLLEDDFVDAMMVKRAMKDIGVKNPLIRVIDGEEGLAYLRDNKNPRPCIIILDLNMPRMNGLEFLKIAKKDNQLKTIPVIVLTTSRADQDKYECFSCSVAGYIVKSIRYEDFMNAMRASFDMPIWRYVSPSRSCVIRSFGSSSACAGDAAHAR